MYSNIVLPLEFVTAFFDGPGFAEHQSGQCGQLVEMLIIILEHTVYLDQKLHTYYTRFFLKNKGILIAYQSLSVSLFLVNVTPP